MADPQLLKSDIKEAVKKRKSVQESVTDEVIFALCGLIGSPLDHISDEVEELMKRRGYQVVPIKVSAIIEKLSGKISPSGETKVERKKRLIDLGDQVRKDYSNDVLSKHIIGMIHDDRVESDGWKEGDKTENRRVCYIINSLKRPEEKKLLEGVYGDLFYVLGVYSNVENRKGAIGDVDSAEVQNLINKDYDEGTTAGQLMRKLYHKSDIFINADENTEVRRSLERFLDVLFGTAIVTPTNHERAMYAAWSAGLNSACLSRQVGAAVVNARGGIVSTGWNDVPKALGGVYGDDTDKDKRCAFLSEKKCWNDAEKDGLSDSLARQILDIKCGDDKKIHDLVGKNAFDMFKNALRESQEISGLLEFSRAVHAEMVALFAALPSEPIKGGGLYVTTYPCHNCARHIILSGVTSVYFIEPYPKSKASTLHFDSWIDDSKAGNGVMVQPFHGIAPNRFDSLFSRSDMDVKKTGKLSLDKWNTAGHRFGVNLEAIPELEKTVTIDYAETAEEQK